MEKIYLARHATPDWSMKDIPYHLPPGPPLIEQGHHEAAELGQFFKNHGVRRLFVSPLERCQTTAQIAAQVSGAELETVESLKEWQPEEDRAAVITRMRPAFETALSASQQDQPVAIVSHGGPITFLLRELGLDEKQLKEQMIYDHQNPVPPAGVWEATRSSSSEPWRLRLAFKPSTSKN